MTQSYADEFWKALDLLVKNSEVIIDRPKGSHHPKFDNIIYPLDYGYLKNTSSMDGSGIDVWVGSSTRNNPDAVIVTVDLLKRDSEIKLLIGLNDDEKKLVCDFHNNSIYMKGIIIERPFDTKQ